MPRAERAREPWSAYDGAVYAVVVARLFEPVLRVPVAGARHLTPAVWAAIFVSVLVNLTVILRLRRRKRRGSRPIYPDSWYRVQLLYGLGLVLLLALVLPPSQFVGRQVGPIGWDISIADLMSLQLFLGCGLIGLHWGFAANLATIPLVSVWTTVCMLINSGRPDWKFVLAWALWTLVNTTAGALGGKVLMRMMHVGFSEEERRTDQFRASELPGAFASWSEHVQHRLAAEVTGLLADRMPAIEQAVKRVSPEYPQAFSAWQELLGPWPRAATE